MAFLGRRHWYRYRSDNGNDYRIQLVDYLAEAAGLVPDDSLPSLPRGFKPRYVWLQAIECTPSTSQPARKKMIIQREDLKRFWDGSYVEVAGIKMRVTGYKGEYRPSPRNSFAPNPLCVEQDK